MEPQYFTKDGRPIEFRYYERDPKDPLAKKDPVKYPWVRHLIEAYIDGVPVGYLKIAYIPLKVWRTFYANDVWAFLRHRKGWAIPKTSDPVEFWDGIVRYTFPEGVWEHIPNGSNPKTRKEAQENIRAFEDAYMKSPYMRDFRRYNVDKPEVDNIRVDEAYQRQGIGHALYQYGARKMAERGLVLHASSIQSDDAKASWRALEERGKPVTRGKGRKKLDYRKMVRRIVARVIQRSHRQHLGSFPSV